MVKAQKIDQKLLIKEDERLEALFRSKIIKTKKLQVDEKQYRNRLIDMLEILINNQKTNGETIKRGIMVYSDVLNKICLTEKYKHLNGQKLIKLLIKLVSKVENNFDEYIDEIDGLIKTIFMILVFKKMKHFASELIEVVEKLLKMKQVKIEKIVGKNLDILIQFIEKGKDIDKIFFSFKRIL